MMLNIIRKVFGSSNDRSIKRLRKQVPQINSYESSLLELDDDALRLKTDEFKQRLADGASLSSIRQEAFAVVREAAKRALNMRHFDVQMIGGMVLDGGGVSEMRTGEGKTLVATLPAYLNALEGKGVHVVTVNDYLAKRDAEWMAQIYEFLGLTVGTIVSGLEHEDRKAAYAADITYGTNNEFGFDYLRDNMVFEVEHRVQRGLHYAIVDEVDSILIDEARTPLVISGPTNDNSELYAQINKIIPSLSLQTIAPDEEQGIDGDGDFVLDEKNRSVHLTEEGHEKVESLLFKQKILAEGESLYDSRNIMIMHHVIAALKAHHLYQIDIEYVIEQGQIVIVDEFTGRKMPGRRWGDGLHQAVEAKEGVEIQNENQTLASITFQNYFRLYNKLSGMTGTADTEAFELKQIYGLDVNVIPTHLPIQRIDHVDRVFQTMQEKYEAIADEIRECIANKQPVLVGTSSIESSEHLSDLLNKANIKHEVLNAKQHAREADIVAQAGAPAAVTIATNMAGRGTDIVLGGNPKNAIAKLNNPSDSEVEKIEAEYAEKNKAVLAAGGLHIIGCERHESRRVDNQLRGRAGRQGDAGSSRFYISLDDNLMRIFAATDRMQSMMQRIGMEKGESIEHPWLSKAIENAQRKVEAHNYDIRKNILEYDDVANEQRKVVYEQRNDLMEGEDIHEAIKAIIEETIENVVAQYIRPTSLVEEWDLEGLHYALDTEFNYKADVRGWVEKEGMHEESLIKRVKDDLFASYYEKEALAGKSLLRRFERDMMLNVLDNNWKEHLVAMDYLRQGIHLRGYAQKNPKQEYKRESFEMFSEMLDNIREEVAKVLLKVKVNDEPVEERRSAIPDNVEYQHADASAPAEEAAEQKTAVQRPVKRDKKIGRNEPCYCGSGKKYKHCHGKLN